MLNQKRVPTPEQLQAYSAVFEDLSDPVIIEDMVGNVQDMNPEAERIYGWTCDELIGRPLKILVPPERHPQTDEILRRCRQREVIRNVETLRRDKNGRDQVVLVTLSLLTNEFNEPVAIASISRDITELRQSQREAKDRAVELERSNEKLREFARICSHDLRAPLRGIAGFADLLQQQYCGRLDQTADEYLSCIVESVERMNGLIDDLLDYARADSEELSLESTDCETLVEEALANLQTSIARSAAQVTREMLPTVQASHAHLLVVFQNLIGNAIKYCGDRPPEVHIAVRSEDNDWIFSVQDNGIGIEADKLQAIFKPFQRLHADDSYEGTGLGLSTCKRIIERHRGRLWAESEPGKGSVFWFTIPKSYV